MWKSLKFTTRQMEIVHKQVVSLIMRRSYNFLTAYVYDIDLKVEANQRGNNYWYEYIKEVLDQLGLKPMEISRQQLEDKSFLDHIGVLIVGDLKAKYINEDVTANLDGWVKGGGILIGFATEGLDFLFGNDYVSTTLQVEDFSLSGYFDLKPHPITSEIHSYLHPEQRLLIFSDIRNMNLRESTEVSRLYNINGGDTGRPAITMRDHGLGKAYYFVFNVPKTIWVLHQGRPILSDYDADGLYRTSDLIVIGGNEAEVLYADEILFLLQNMIGQRKQPFIHQIPPVENKIPDALFHWGGDDEGVQGSQLWASNWMKSKGLPYHINVMPNKAGEFSLSVDEAKAIEANGHEISLHINFMDGYKHPLEFTESDIRSQTEAFHAKYGKYPVCVVYHYTLWTDWEKPAEWMLACGILADNSRVPIASPPINPINSLGFSFGTSYPYHLYDDYEGENKKLDLLILPITAYEPGYMREGYTTDFPMIHKVIDLAVKYHLTMNMFFHTVCIKEYTACRAAIEEAVRYIRERGIIAKHMGNDQLCIWWEERSKSTISDLQIDEEEIVFIATCNYPEGMIVKVPLGDADAYSVKCDGRNAIFQNRREFGQNWVYLISPSGRHKIEVKTQDGKCLLVS